MLRLRRDTSIEHMPQGEKGLSAIPMHMPSHDVRKWGFIQNKMYANPCLKRQRGRAGHTRGGARRRRRCKEQR